MAKKQGSQIDVHVGGRVRLRRMLVGMSQEKLGDLLGLTFQQVQKYEKGANRIGAGRLYQIARILDVPVQFFFDDMPQSAAPAKSSEVRHPDLAPLVMDYVTSVEGLQLNRHFFRIRDMRVRRRFLDLVKALAGEDAETEAAQ